MMIGITGPTGAGKTTLLHEVEKLGGAVIDCDVVYHDLLESDIALQDSLEKAFGPLRDGSGKIDRKKLGEIVFNHPGKLKRLNSIAERQVTACGCQLIDQYRRQGRTLIAVDAISLQESLLWDMCDVTVAVLAPPEVRVERIMAREGISKEYAWARVKAQKPDEYFKRNCSHSLINDSLNVEEFSQKAKSFLEGILR